MPERGVGRLVDMRRLGSLLVLIVLAGLLASCSGEQSDEHKVISWLNGRSDVAAVVEQHSPEEPEDVNVQVRLDTGRSDGQVWDFVDDFQQYVDDFDYTRSYRLDVDGFEAYLPGHGTDSETREEAAPDLVRALWLRADGRATSVGTGDEVSVSVLITAPGDDVAKLALDLRDLPVDTGDSIRVEAPDRSVTVQWTTRLDFDLDVAALKEFIALQKRFPGTHGWLTGVSGETSTGIVFSPEDISLNRLRRALPRLAKHRAHDRLSIGWGVVLTDRDSFAEATDRAATRRAYEALSRIPGARGSGYPADVVATDKASFRAIRQVLAAHPDSDLSSVAYAPVPSPFLGNDRDAVFTVDSVTPRSYLLAYRKVFDLPDVWTFNPDAAGLEVSPDIDDAQLRTALVLLAKVKPDLPLQLFVEDRTAGLGQTRGITELALDGTATRDEVSLPTDEAGALLTRAEAIWAELVADR